MESFAIYLIKVNVALIVLYAFYKLSFSKDTFFRLKRMMLLLICATSLIYPFIELSNWADWSKHSLGQAMNTIYVTILPEIWITPLSGVTPPDASITDNTISTSTWLWIIYGIGVGLLLMRTFLEFGKIYSSLLHSQKCSLKGISVYQSKEMIEPCSFFHWIFIKPELYTEKEINEILIHEQTHVREYHSLDILLAQLIILLCWFNPFAWLIRSEIRMNHEYLADKQVIASGHDKKIYQYHLLGIKHTSLAAANLYNNFSVLPLKKRIKMLNRRRTSNIMISKYLMFIPVVALLLLFSNCANNKSSQEKSAAETTEMAPAVESEKTVEPEKTVQTSVAITEAEKKDEIGDEEVFEVVEQMPEYPGGNQELMKFLSSNIKYPTNAIENKIEGRVIIQFIVSKDGNLKNVKIVRSIDKELDAEALRVINAMPKWKPGMQKGEVVNVRYTVPVTFRLQ
ncbi:TonB family protein [uncultured Bacteroides sp.]|uniref:TonB family protein n=1 Tax=uncultured Bacteroides sp. TaxID=162156 RepID=UPI0025D37D37|nr:TonB family protein [uncultured Bacteroides sp.]